jgi:hypothetical protein
MEARADRIQTYPYPCTPACKITNNCMLEKICQKYKTRPIRRPYNGMNKYCLTIGKEAKCDMTLYLQGFMNEVGQQDDCDFKDREAIVLPYTSPDIWDGEWTTVQQQECVGQTIDMPMGDITLELKNKDVKKREDLWRTILWSGLISLSINNQLYIESYLGGDCIRAETQHCRNLVRQNIASIEYSWSRQWMIESWADSFRS